MQRAGKLFRCFRGNGYFVFALQHSMEFVNLKPTVRWRAAILPTHTEKPISSHPSPRPLGNPKIIKPGEKRKVK